jgi:Putative Ig domain
MHTHALAVRTRLLCALALLSVSFFAGAPALAAAPKISGTPVTTTLVGNNWSFTPTASDADHNTLTFSIANKPGFASFSTTTGQVSGVPFAEHARTWSNITISVSDGTSTVSLPAFSLVVKPNPNKTPTISGTPPSTATVGQLYSYQWTAKDPEGKAVTFSIRNKPTWATFSTSTGKLSGTPTAAGVASHITIIVTDGVSSTAAPWFDLTVKAGGGSTNSPPVISGTPPSTAAVGAAYTWTPSLSDANNDPLTLSLSGKPAWASFDSKTGRVYGTPSASYAGTTTSSTLSVSDGKTTTTKSFTITVGAAGGGGTVGSVTLNWSPPTHNTDGSTLTNIAGYRVVYGKSAGALTSTVQIANPGISSYVIDNLASGTWYFALKVYTSSGTESALTNVASKSIP